MCHKFSSQHCFSCVLEIFIFCSFIFIWFNVFLKNFSRDFLFVLWIIWLISSKVFEDCPVIFLLLISSLIQWCLKNIFCIILVLFNLTRFVLWPKSWSILAYVWLTLVSSILSILKTSKNYWDSLAWFLTLGLWKVMPSSGLTWFRAPLPSALFQCPKSQHFLSVVSLPFKYPLSQPIASLSCLTEERLRRHD